MDQPGIKRDIFRRRAIGALPLPVAKIDPPVLKVRIDTLADHFDRTGTVAMRDDAVEPHRPRSGAGLDIGQVHPRCAKAHQNLAGCRLQHRHLSMDEHIRNITVRLVPDSIHQFRVVPGMFQTPVTAGRRITCWSRFLRLAIRPDSTQKLARQLAKAVGIHLAKRGKASTRQASRMSR